MHVHVTHSDGEAKFWLEPALELAMNKGLSQSQVREALTLIMDNEGAIRHAWTMHFGG